MPELIRLEPVVNFKQVPEHNLNVEWERADPRLQALVLVAASISLAVFGLPVFVTTIERTPAEQARLYPENPTKPSPHIPDTGGSRAVDLRVRHAVNPGEYGARLVLELSARFQTGAAGMPVALFEPAVIRNGVETRTAHLHLQVRRSIVPIWT